MQIGKGNVNFNQDFKDGYQAAIDYILVCSKMLRLQHPNSPTKRKQLCDLYFNLIDELRQHMKYNEELEARRNHDAKTS